MSVLKKNPKTILLDNGEMAEAQHPVIVSASRSTDIPAFYIDWFFKRLEKGYSAWTNPFNGKRSFVAYDQTRFIVFWSKNPRPLLSHLDKLKERGVDCYIQYSLNDYEKEGLEKNVPPLSQRIETFHTLVERLGLGGVVWRFDPMLLTDSIGIDELLRKVEYIGDQLKGYTEKLVFSYADILEYRKVENNLKKNNIAYRVWDDVQMIDLAKGLSELNSRWRLNLATCGENVDLISRFGIEKNRCVDGDLIVKRGYKNKPLMDFLKVKIITPQKTLFGTDEIPEDAIMLPNGQYFRSIHKKDPGQRKLCGCMLAKDIGEYNTCPHQCEYCYANTSKQIALENYKRHLLNGEAETITGK